MFVTRRFMFLIIFAPLILGAEESHYRLDKDARFHATNLTEVTLNPPANNSTDFPVKFAPTFTHPAKMYPTMLKPAGSFIRLKCKAEGNPAPNITWFKNHEATITRPYFPAVYGKWSLALEDLTKADAGNYTCLVCNELGCINHTVEVNILVRYPSKPLIEENYPRNITALWYETVIFSCPVTCDLEPYIYWTWRSPNATEELKVQSADPNDKPDKFTLYNVTASVEGWYKCTAMNMLGSASAQGYLRVMS